MILHSQFTHPSGNEDFFSGSAIANQSKNSTGQSAFAQDALTLLQDYENAKKIHNVKSEPFLLRFHLSDISNQAPVLRQIIGKPDYMISMVGQAPVGSRIALEAWHCPEIAQKYPLKWTALAENNFSGSYDQTREEFEELKRQLSPALVANSVLRTWLYCRDVDNNYSGLVHARNDFFAENGINKESGFFASTGIEGQHEDPHRLVKMDTLSMIGIKKSQIQHLSAPQWLSDTILYGVSFERGSKIVLDNRNWYFISGTASIDSKGQVLYSGDVQSQTNRMIDNIEALLQNGNAALKDLRQGILYLRDVTDAPMVQEVLYRRLPKEFPLIFLHAPVCRPTWLVEMEAFGVNRRH